MKYEISPQQKLGSYANKISIDHQQKYQEDPCTNECAQVVNARIRDKTCERAFVPRIIPVKVNPLPLPVNKGLNSEALFSPSKYPFPF